MKALKYGLIAGVLLLLAGGIAAGSSQLSNLEDKLKLFIGSFRIHTIGISQTVIAVDNTKIMNQSPIGVDVNNLYVTVKYNDGNSWQDLLIQTNNINSFTIAANSSSKVPSIYLTVNSLSGSGIFYKIFNGSISPILKVVTRFQVLGYETEITQDINANQYLSVLKSVIAA